MRTGILSANHYLFTAPGVSKKQQEIALTTAILCEGPPNKWVCAGYDVCSFGDVHNNGWRSIYSAAVAYCRYHQLPFEVSETSDDNRQPEAF